MRRTRQVIAAIPGAFTVLGFLVGLPAALVVWVGYPLPRHMPSSSEWLVWLDHPITPTILTDGVACIMWAMWAVLVYVAIATVVTGLAKIKLPVPRLAVSMRAALGSLAGAGVIAANSAAALPAVASVAAHTTPVRGLDAYAAGEPHGDAFLTVTSTQGPIGGLPTLAVAGFDGQMTIRTGVDHYTVTVRRHDTLWDIADTWLGDPHRWPEIYHLNRSHYDQHGRMRHGNLILPGWILILPDDAAPPPGATPSPHPPGTAVPAPGTSPPPAPTDPTPRPSATTGNRGESGAPATPGPRVSVARSPAAPAAAHGHGGSLAPNPPTSTGDSPGSSATDVVGIDLGDRGWVSVEVAAAVLAAAALIWIQRRRRYRPGPASTRRRHTDLTPLPRTIVALHSAHPSAAHDDVNDLEPYPTVPAPVTIASLGIHPDRTPLRLPDLPERGIGLIGVGAGAAARGMIAAVLSAGGPWAPGAEARIITTRADLAQLLPDIAELPVMERLHIADTMDAALGELERQLLRRARLADTDSDVTSDPNGDGDPPMPPTVLLAGAPTGSRGTRLAAILVVGSRFALTAVLTGQWPHGDTWHVHTAGTTTDMSDTAGPRLNILDPVATLDILDTLRQARPETDDLPPGPSSPQMRPASPSTERRPRPAVDPMIPQAANGVAAANTHVSSAVTSRPVEVCRLQVAVLGRPAVAIASPDGHSGLRIRRRDGVQILVNLAVNPHGASSDELMALVWPEIRPHHARRRFHTTMSELRLLLDESIGAEAIPRTDERYRLDPDHVDVDLWHLNAAVERSSIAVDPGAHDRALHQVIDGYHGTVAEGHSWLWLAPYREEVRRHVLDAHVELADLAVDPRTALAHIQDAIRLDPYNEDVYQRAMYLHAKLGSLDGVRRTLRALSERLAELEVRVSPQTQQVASDIARRLDPRQRPGGDTS